MASSKQDYDDDAYGGSNLKEGLILIHFADIFKSAKCQTELVALRLTHFNSLSFPFL